jgi:hypothetical protein
VPNRTIFRQTAVEAHRRGTQRDVIPRLVSRPITVCRWLLVAVLVTATALSWAVRVPVYVSGSGVLTGPGTPTTALLVLPPQDAPQLTAGRPVRIQVGPSATVTRGEVSRVEPGVATPQEAARRHPELGPGLVTQPSVIVVVRLAAPPPSGSTTGSRVTAQVQDGTQSLIAVLSGLASRSAG